MNTVLAMLLAMTLDGAVSEVGAPYPQLANSAPHGFVVASVETGASTSWATRPVNKLASFKQTKEFEIHVGGFDAKLSQELDSLISEKLESLIAFE